LLKIDFLGLRNLDVIEDALDIVERSTGERPDFSTLPLDDAKAYEMLARGDSVGVFQFESEGMREALKKVRPTEFEDLVALNALYRPGVIDQIPTNGQVIEWLWATNERSADYSFNRSHAACYALIAYRTAWLKANYPAEYMAALISSVMDTKDKVPFFVSQAEQMGISILPPDVNLSDHEFVVVDGNIRFGLDAVKGVGYAAVEAIKAARGAAGEAGGQGGPFRDLWDFCARVDGRA